MFIWFDARQFLSSWTELQDAIDANGLNAWKAATQSAKESQHEHNYQNRTGKLTASMSFSVTEPDKFGWRSEVKTSARYALFVDKPTKAHEILPVRAKYLRWYAHGVPVFAKRVWHPGTKGSKFSEFAAQTFEQEIDSLLQPAVDAAIESH